MAGELTLRRSRTALDAIERECTRDLPPDELLIRVDERLRSAFAYDGDGWMLLDPATLMFTGGVRSYCTPDLNSRLMENEFLHDDVLSFRALARSRSGAASLWQVTGGQPERSTRYRTIYGPIGAGDELRGVFRADGTCWGAVSLVRTAAREPFTEAETTLVAAASGHVGNALRRALARSGAPRPASADTPAGILILNPDDTVQSQTSQAARLLGEAQRADGKRLPLPVAVYSVAHQARAVAARRAPASRAAARVWLGSGRWLAVDAAPLDDADGGAGRVAVLLQTARAAQLASLVLASRGVTAREQQIALMLLRGDATDQIAQRLVISRHTLRDHIKTVYAKRGVSSRPELTALLLNDDAIPHPWDTAGGRPRPG
jgi:DNA-binding CsgD family transcriptional regulator